MANNPPPYSEQPACNPNYQPQNPGGYPTQSQAPYPSAGAEKGGYPPTGPPAGQPGAYYPPSGGQQPGYYPPQVSQPTGYYPPPPAPGNQAPPAQQQVIVVSNQPAELPPGVCRHCRVGHGSDNFTCCGICLAIFCFPIGLICCILMRERRCSNCGAGMWASCGENSIAWLLSLVLTSLYNLQFRHQFNFDSFIYPGVAGTCCLDIVVIHGMFCDFSIYAFSSWLTEPSIDVAFVLSKLLTTSQKDATTICFILKYFF